MTQALPLQGPGTLATQLPEETLVGAEEGGACYPSIHLHHKENCGVNSLNIMSKYLLA